MFLVNIGYSQVVSPTGCPCAGTTSTNRPSTSGSQAATPSRNWDNVTATGATEAFTALNLGLINDMEVLTFTIPALSPIDATIRFCSETAPTVTVTTGLTLGYNNTTITGSYTAGWTITVAIGVTLAIGNLTVTVNPSVLVTQSGCPLPIELTSFQGIQDGNCAKLTWTTASEQQNDYFTIEKLVGDVYVPIGKVRSLYNTSLEESNYEFTDCETTSINYYRLIQTDLNGDWEIVGELISVPLEHTLLGEVMVVPNPSNDVACVVTQEDIEAVQIFSPEGKLVLERNNFPEQVRQVCTMVSDLTPGVYVVRTTTYSGVYTRHLVKQ